MTGAGKAKPGVASRDPPWLSQELARIQRKSSYYGISPLALWPATVRKDLERASRKPGERALPVAVVAHIRLARPRHEPEPVLEVVEPFRRKALELVRKESSQRSVEKGRRELAGALAGEWNAVQWVGLQRRQARQGPKTRGVRSLAARALAWLRGR